MASRSSSPLARGAEMSNSPTSGRIVTVTRPVHDAGSAAAAATTARSTPGPLVSRATSRTASRERRAVSFVPSGVVVVDAEVFDGRVRGVGDLHQRARQRGAALDAREERVGRQTQRSVALGEGRAQRRAGRARGGIEDNLGGSRAAREGYRAREDREH